MPIIGLLKLIEQNKKENMIVAEIGCFTGESTKAYMDIIKKNNGHTYVVDWFCGNIDAGPGPHGYNPKNKDNILLQFKQNCKDYLDNITILIGKTHDKVNNIPDAILDICYIDADHRYNGVSQDIRLYLPKVKIGGIIGGHDCEDYTKVNSFSKIELNLDWCSSKHCHPGVIQAVWDNFGEDINIINDPPHNTWYHIKK